MVTVMVEPPPHIYVCEVHLKAEEDKGRCTGLLGVAYGYANSTHQSHQDLYRSDIGRGRVPNSGRTPPSQNVRLKHRRLFSLAGKHSFFS